MKIVVLEIYSYDNNKITNVEIEVFKTKESCKQFINKFFEDINYHNFIDNKYTESGWILNDYEDYMYNVSEKEIN